MNLKNVTLAAATCRDYDTTLEALKHVQRLIEFKNILYFSDVNPGYHPGITYIPVKTWNYETICVWFLTQMHKYNHLFGDFIMGIHHDGYPCKLDEWADDFLNYDFIGSPWTDGAVGNNGFCIYSKKFIESLGKLNLPPFSEFCHPCDQKIFRTLKGYMQEQFGTIIAPYQLACHFGAEGHRYERDTPFGFHGLWNIPCMKGIPGITVMKSHEKYLDYPDFHRYTPKG